MNEFLWYLFILALINMVAFDVYFLWMWWHRRNSGIAETP